MTRELNAGHRSPGPWTVEDHPGGTSKYRVVSQSRLCVATVASNQPANANLIAASPDLLEACKRLLSNSGLVVPSDGKFARAAISKAEGRTP